MIVQVAIYVGVSRVSEGGALEVSSSRGGLCGGFRFIFRSGYLRTLVRKRTGVIIRKAGVACVPLVCSRRL